MVLCCITLHCIIVEQHGQAVRLSPACLGFNPQVTLAAQHILGTALEATRVENPHNEFLMDVGQIIKCIVVVLLLLWLT